MQLYSCVYLCRVNSPLWPTKDLEIGQLWSPWDLRIQFCDTSKVRLRWMVKAWNKTMWSVYGKNIVTPSCSWNGNTVLACWEWGRMWCWVYVLLATSRIHHIFLLNRAKMTRAPKSKAQGGFHFPTHLLSWKHSDSIICPKGDNSREILMLQSECWFWGSSWTFKHPDACSIVQQNQYAIDKRVVQQYAVFECLWFY